MAMSKKAVETLGKKHQIPVDLLMKIMEKEIKDEQSAIAILRVPYRIGATLYRSMAHASRFFREIRENGVFYAGICPKCGHTIFPPQKPVCNRCIKKGELFRYDYMDLGPVIEGVIISWSRLERGTSKQSEMLKSYPSYIKVDGSDIAHWQLVEVAPGQEIKIGARVRSALRPQKERTGEISDYWFTLIG